MKPRHLRDFVLALRTDGKLAPRTILKTSATLHSMWATHGPRGDIMSAYTSVPWSALCDEVTKLKIALKEGALISLRHDQRQR